MKKKKLILIRGIPGSGKSTLAKKILEEIRAEREVWVEHYEADMYFTSPAGTYTYIGERIGEAHEWCHEQTEMFIRIKSFPVTAIVSNTFTRKSEIQPYIDLAEKHGAEIEIIEATGNYGSVHNVPEEVVQKMRDRWETL